MSQNLMMDVLYIQGLAQGFGYVLGIFTRTAEPAQPETDASAFVADGLPLGGLVLGQDLVIPASLIGICRVPRNWRQIFQPTAVFASGLPGSPSLAAITGTLTVSVATDVLTITAAPAPSAAGNILVLALDEAGGAPVPFSVPIATGQGTVTSTLTGLNTGDKYNAFAFLPSYPMATTNFTF
jgi:hypothetical protein